MSAACLHASKSVLLCTWVPHPPYTVNDDHASPYAKAYNMVYASKHGLWPMGHWDDGGLWATAWRHGLCWVPCRIVVDGAGVDMHKRVGVELVDRPLRHTPWRQIETSRDRKMYKDMCRDGYVRCTRHVLAGLSLDQLFHKWRCANVEYTWSRVYSRA